MRLPRIDRYLLLLAALFVLAVLPHRNLGVESVLPEVYRALVHAPLLAQALPAGSGGDAGELKNRVATLERRIRELEEQVQSARALSGYFAQLKWPAAPVAVPGFLLSVEPGSYRRFFRLDCGASMGVLPGMPVVSGTALLGVVEWVEPGQCVVRRVDDDRFRVEVEIPAAEGPAHGVAWGSSGDLRVEFVRGAASLPEGAPVFTTAYDPAIPPGLLVGRVSEVEDLDE
ncbi:MAG: rod shape-determining protein MreC, partial [Planctomycetota bacterium]